MLDDAASSRVTGIWSLAPVVPSQVNTSPQRQRPELQRSTATPFSSPKPSSLPPAFHHVCDTENRSPLPPRYANPASPSYQCSVYLRLPDLKNTTDDALPNYLHSLKFRQIHTQTDVRLALGYTAVAIAGALFYFDWKFGWEASKPYTAPAVVAYFLLNGAFTYWMWFVEGGVVYEGEGKTGKVRLLLCIANSSVHWGGPVANSNSG